jgi:hypothetical protein
MNLIKSNKYKLTTAHAKREHNKCLQEIAGVGKLKEYGKW